MFLILQYMDHHNNQSHCYETATVQAQRLFLIVGLRLFAYSLPELMLHNCTLSSTVVEHLQVTKCY